MTDMFLIQRGQHYVGNSLVWWRPNSHGYTCNIDEAGRYSADEARDIELQSMGQNIAWEEGAVIRMSSRHVDMQHVPAPGGRA